MNRRWVSKGRIALMTAMVTYSAAGCQAQSRNLLEGGDPAKLEAFKLRFEGEKKSEEGKKHWQWSFNTWNKGTTAEFYLAENIEGSKALALRNLSGAAASQFYNWKKLDLNALRRYEVSLDYLTTGGAHGSLELSGDNVPNIPVPLPDTANKWLSVSKTIDATTARNLGLQFKNATVGAERVLYLRNIAVRDVGQVQLSAEEKTQVQAALGLKPRPLQNIAAGSLYSKLREEFKTVGDGFFIFGESPDEATQSLSNGQLIDVQGQPFSKAKRVEVKNRQDQPWMVNMTAKNKEPIHKGDLILVTFYARGKKGPEKVDSGTGAVVQPYIKSKAGPLTEYHSIREITPEWDRYWVKSSAPAPRDLAPGEAELLVMLGHKAQDIEIGGLAVMAFPAGSNAAALPKVSFDYAGREADAAWRKEAQTRIERLRKGDLTVQVVNAAGQPVPGAQVHAQMKKHQFLFGTAVALPRWLGTNMSEKDKTNYRQKILDHFNMMEPENSLKWRAFTEWGQSLEDTEKQLRWAREHGLYTRGHVLVWPSWEHTPAKVKEQVKDDPEALRTVVRQHVTDTVTRLKGLIDDWDVTNETQGNRDYMDILGPEEMIVWYQLARQADPNVKLTFNEPDFKEMEGGSFPDAKFPGYRGWVDYLVKHKAPFDRLGTQEHGGTMAKIGKKTDPAQAWKLWDDFYERYGKEIIFTELDVNIDDDRDEEQLRYQADVLRDTLILTFAHERVVGVNQWGFWEKAHWYPKSALWRSDWSIKPNGQAYLDLVYKDWWTDTKGNTAANGAFVTRGFTGDYEVTVTAGGKTKTVQTALPTAGQTLQVTLD